MSGLEAILLGVVRGLTEVLPLSSSGHLAIAEALLARRGEGILFEVAVRAGILLAILAFFRGRVRELIGGLLGLRAEAIGYAGKLVVATLPAVVVGLVLKDSLGSLFDRPWLPGAGLLASGVVLMTTRSTMETAGDPEPGWGQALAIGCAQVLAIVPGISRSGITVAAALALGVAPLAATEFSFLLAVVAITVAAAVALPGAAAASAAEMQPLLAGGLAALASGLAALWLFVRLLRSRHFHQLAYYLWAVGTAFLIWTLAIR